MKKYFDNFRQYQFLLSELVKKGIKLKYRRSYLGILWSMLEPLLTMIVLTIVLKYRQNFPCIHSVRTSFVQLLFIRNQNYTEIHTVQFRYD